MILILTRKSDYSSGGVINWIENLGGNYRRLNESEFSGAKTIHEFNLSNEADEFIMNADAPLNFEKVDVIWYRRWIYQESFRSLFNLTENKIWAACLYDYLYAEINAFSNAFFASLGKVKWVDNPIDVKNIKKIEVLRKAKAHGLTIPNTIITNNKLSVVSFLNKNGRIISKPITEIAYFDDSDHEFSLLTKEVTMDNLLEGTDTFHPTLFQQLIEKNIDIRVFFLDGKCYSMAILSQKHAGSSVDFRQFVDSKPVRMVPYRLSEELEGQIASLMKSVNLNSGSLDFVLSTLGIYYFLEINPVGQFGMTSFPCNYNLEKKIAEYLIKQDAEND